MLTGCGHCFCRAMPRQAMQEPMSLRICCCPVFKVSGCLGVQVFECQCLQVQDQHRLMLILGQARGSPALTVEACVKPRAYRIMLTYHNILQHITTYQQTSTKALPACLFQELAHIAIQHDATLQHRSLQHCVKCFLFRSSRMPGLQHAQSHIS
jgi:hypothetical protein